MLLDGLDNGDEKDIFDPKDFQDIAVGNHYDMKIK